MQSQRKKHDDKGNSWIGWLIFVLIIAGGPILNTIQSMLGPGVRLPSYLLPLIVGALVIISAAISIMRAVGGGRGDQSAFPPSTPMSQSAPARPTMRERPMS
ncbi:MAG TPA: hypothetical protein PKA05_23115, partial [Roseiflexaceae bacterium]|nr:hypothetical protein [Roseiflexaceae bacterium]